MARYEISAPDGSSWEVTAPEGATEDAVMRYAQAQWKAKPPKREERSIGDSIVRQLGLTARSAVGGIGSIANMIADPVVSGINAISGGNLPIPSQALERTMTRAGLPEPDSGTERLAQSVNRGMIAAAGGGRLIPGNTLPMREQIVSGGAGAGGADLAGQAGFGPVGQTVAGIASGIVAPSAALGALEGTKAIARATPALVEPLTKGGRERIAARALQGAARDKDAAIAAARSAPEFVPGSIPTLAQATDDVGLAAQGKAIENRFRDDFSQRARQQDAARQAGLTKSFGTATDLTMAEANRDEVTKALREAAFDGAKKVNTKPIISTANAIKKASAREEANKAMSWVAGRLEEAGNDPRRLYDVRQDINDVIAGKVRDPEKASYVLAAKQLTSVKRVLDAQLEKAAPGFGKYIKTYAGMTREIDRARLGQEIAEKGTNKLHETLSPAAFTREFERRSQEIAEAGPVASDSLTRVAMDLRRASSPNASVRPPGSDTLQNFVANNMLSRAGVQSGGPVSNAASKVLGFGYRALGSEDQILDLLRNAHLDPTGEGARLLSMELSKMPPSVIDGLMKKLNAVPMGGLLGINAAN